MVRKYQKTRIQRRKEEVNAKQTTKRVAEGVVLVVTGGDTKVVLVDISVLTFTMPV